MLLLSDEPFNCYPITYHHILKIISLFHTFICNVPLTQITCLMVSHNIENIVVKKCDNGLTLIHVLNLWKSEVYSVNV